MASIASNLSAEGIVGAQRFEFAFSSSSWTPPGAGNGPPDQAAADDAGGWAPRHVFAIIGVLIGLAAVSGVFISFELARGQAEREAKDRMRHYEDAMNAVEAPLEAGSPPALHFSARQGIEAAPSEIAVNGATRVKILVPDLDRGALETARAIVEAIERGRGKGGDERR